MKPIIPYFLFAISSCCLWACESSSLEGIAGRWVGKITCLGQTSDLSLSLTVENELLYGSAQIRTKDSNSDYSARGGQSETDRFMDCKESECLTTEDCSLKLNQQGEPGKSQCQNGLCTPCFENQTWSLVTLTLKDNNVQIPDPELSLWRFGNDRLEGTIKKYCPDEAIQTPQVKITKQ
jgi:hypothetical protein